MLKNRSHPMAIVLALGMLMLLSSPGALVSIQRGTVGARPDRGEVRTWYVDDDGNAEYVKIQDAIDTAGEGDTIRVWEGTYYENVVVDKSIDLIGNGSETTTIDGGGSGDVVRITADRVGMGGFIVTGSGSWHAGMRIESNYNRIFENNCTSNYYGILLDSCFNNILSNNTCSSKEYGISLKHSGNNILIRNTCFDNEYGVTIVSDSNNNTISRGICTSNRVGILVDRDSNGNTVSKNICIDNQKGISIFGSNINIINNTCLENEYGISIGSESNKITVSKNICINNTSGIRLESSDHNTISNNSCSSNSKHGIILKDSGNNVICNNTYSSREYGMYFHNSSNNLLSNNNIMESKVGVYFFHFSDRNTIHHNKIFDNTEYGICFYSSNGNTLSNNTITGNDVGIFLHDYSKKNSARYNSIYNNPDYGIDASYNDGCTIHATQNYWGDPSGPHHPTKNPAGKGDRITDFVDFEPWLCAQYNEDYYNGRLSGHVTDAFNSPLENVEIRVEDHKTFRLAFSDENGYYSISKLPICNCTKKVIAFEEGCRDFEREIEIGENTILTIILIPENQPPVLTILSPKNNSEASGKILIRGTVYDQEGNSTCVEMSIGDGEWLRISNDTNWEFQLDTRKLEDGTCLISIRACDGEDYSGVRSLSLRINNEGHESGGGGLSFYFALMGVIIFVAVVVFEVVMGNFFYNEKEGIFAGVGGNTKKEQNEETGEPAPSKAKPEIDYDSFRPPPDYDPSHTPSISITTFEVDTVGYVEGEETNYDSFRPPPDYYKTWKSRKGNRGAR